MLTPQHILPLDGGVRQRAQYVDSVMRAVYAMLRSAPNYDGSIGNVECAVWDALNADSAAANMLAESRLEQMTADRAQALRWRDQFGTAEREIARLMGVIGSVNSRCDHLGMRLGEVIRERDRLSVDLALLRLNLRA